MTGTAPLDAYPLVRTGSVEELRAALARLISNPRKLEPVGRDGRLRAVHNHYPLKHIGISYGTYGTAIHFQLPGPKVISQIYPIAGKAEVTVDGTTVTIDAAHGATLSEVAFACGFRDRSRFKMAYAQAFGEPPEDTLKRGKGLH